MFHYKTLKDSKSSWLLFFVLFMLWAILYMSKNCFSTAMAAIVKEGFMTKSQTSIITAAFWFVYAPGQVIGGIFSDRKKPQGLILIAIFGAAIINLGIYFFYSSYAFMLIVWTLNAALQFAAWPSVFKIISTQLKKEKRTNFIFLISVSTTVGLMFGYIVSALVTKWQTNFLVSSISLFAIGFIFLVVYNTLLKRMEPEEIEIKQVANHNLKHEPLGSLIKRSGLLPICFGAFLCNSMINGPKGLAATMLVETYDSMSVSLANILNAFIIATGILSIAVGRFIYPKYIKTETLIVAVALLFALPSFALTTGAGSLPVAVVVVGLIIGLLATTLSFTFISSYIPARFNIYGMGGTMAGLINAMGALANVFSSYVFSVVSESKGGWFATSVLWIGLLVIGAILFFIINPIWKKFTSEL